MRLVNADMAPIYLNEAACEQIKNMPAVDAVEVVRCCDCEQWFENKEDENHNGFCFLHSAWLRPYDVCSYGERKEGEVDE